MACIYIRVCIYLYARSSSATTWPDTRQITWDSHTNLYPSFSSLLHVADRQQKLYTYLNKKENQFFKRIFSNCPPFPWICGESYIYVGGLAKYVKMNTVFLDKVHDAQPCDIKPVTIINLCPGQDKTCKKPVILFVVFQPCQSWWEVEWGYFSVP